MKGNTLNEEQIKFIASQLKDLKSLEVLNSLKQQEDHRNIIFVQGVEDSDSKYALKIESFVNINNGVVNKQKQQQSENEAIQMKEYQHINIAQVQDYFNIGIYHFTQLKHCVCTLNYWVTQNSDKTISDLDFLALTNQILNGIEYIHNKKLVLRDFSLNSILLTGIGDIKLYDFGSPQIHKNVTKKQLSQNLPYLPPDVIEKLCNHEEVKQSEQEDIWAFGACLSFLGGGKIKQYQKSQFMITYSKNLSPKANELIKFILNVDPLQRPSIKEIREQMKILFLQNQIQENQQLATEQAGEEQKIIEEEVEPSNDQQQSNPEIILQLTLKSFLDEVVSIRQIESKEQKQQSNRIYLNSLFVIGLGVAVIVTSLDNSYVFLILLCVQLLLSIISFIWDKLIQKGKYTSIGLLVVQSLVELVTLIFTNTDYDGINVTYSVYVLITQLYYLGPLKYEKSQICNQKDNQNQKNGLFRSIANYFNSKNFLFYFLIIDCLPIFICIGLADSQNLKIVATIRLIVFYVAYISIWLQIKLRANKVKISSQFNFFIRFLYISLSILDFFIFYQDFTQVSNHVLGYFAIANTLYIGIVASMIFNIFYMTSQLWSTFASVSSFIAQSAPHRIYVTCYIVFSVCTFLHLVSLLFMHMKQIRKQAEKWIQITQFISNFTLFSIILLNSIDDEFKKGRNYGIAFFCCLIIVARFTYNNIVILEQKKEDKKLVKV